LGEADNLTKKIWVKADVPTLKVGITGWTNINGQGDFNAPHTHPGHIWSSLYYASNLAVEEGTSGMIEFWTLGPTRQNGASYLPRHSNPKSGSVRGQAKSLSSHRT
jgi:hypothetical protein